MKHVKMTEQKSQSSKRNIFTIIFWLLFISLVLFLLLYRLNDYPNLFWDEGWTLDAAQNWIKYGHLGHFLDGQTITARSPVRFPVVVPIAVSMKLFGVGIWQGRLPSVLFTLISLGLMIFLSSQMFNRKVGIASVIMILLISPLHISAIYFGRTVLAEMPMMVYLLGGYSMMWLALKNSSVMWGIGAAILFGIALHAKLQVPPFWLISMIIAIFVAIWYHQRRSIFILCGVVFGSIAISVIVIVVQNMFMPGSLSDPAFINLLINSVILVFTWPVRRAALITIVLNSLPQLIGYIWAGYLLINALIISRNYDTKSLEAGHINKAILSIALWSLGASWFVWYSLMGLFWVRYLFPPFFIGCIFFAGYVGEISGNYNIRIFVWRASRILLGRDFNWINLQAVLLLIIMSVMLGITLITGNMYLFSKVPNAIQTATYLHNNIPIGARVESYESELLFLAPEFIYHFPSDLINMRLVRRKIIDPELHIEYDSSESAADYLVVGPYSQTWNLYDVFLSKGCCQFVEDIGGYKIFQIKASKIKE